MNDAQKIFKALSDTTRFKIIYFLLSGEKCVCQIFPYVKRTQSTTSIQLKKLENLGIIASRRDGKWIYYRIKNTRICGVLKASGIKGEFTCMKKVER